MWRRFFPDKKVHCKLSRSFSINMEQFVNSIQLAIFIETLDGQLFFSNAMCNNEFSNLWEQSTGRLKESLTKHSHVINNNNEVIKTRKTISFILDVPNHEGMLKKVECVKQPYFNECGELIGVITFFHDMKSDSRFITSDENKLEKSGALINRFSDGNCQFEYFPNGEGRFLELSTDALILLGLTESAVNKKGITGCISPAICDKDRVNIALAFKNIDSDTNKLACSFRYNSKGKIRQCNFVAIRDVAFSEKSQSSLWHGIFIDVGIIGKDAELEKNLAPLIDQGIRNKEPWLLFKYHQALVDGLTLNLINFKICQQPTISDVLNNTANIVFMLDDLVQQYGRKWLDCIIDFKGKVIVVATNGEQLHYYTESIVQIPLTQISKIKFATLFCHTDSSLANKAPFQPCNFNVLVAEDNQINQFLIKNQLEQLGCDVTIVCNGKIALEKLNEQKFDIVITDCQMPVIDGFELAKQIRQNALPTIRDLPIIGLTADNSKDISVLSHNVGINHVLFKPYAIADLYEVLIDLVESSALGHNDVESLVCSEIAVPELSQWVGVFGTEADAVTMARIFHETLEADILALQKAIEENNPPMCQKILHRIKGSIVMVKMDTITQQIEECEAFISLENRIDNRLNKLVTNLVQINKVVLTWLV